MHKIRICFGGGGRQPHSKVEVSYPTLWAGLPDFSWYNNPYGNKYTKEPHKIYQMATKYTKWQQNIPNGRKLDQSAIK
jgi:hypothetical protein